MNDADKRMMDLHGITCATRKVYFFRGFKYDRLEDAVRYAVLDSRRDAKADPAK